jgi:hypothetical protein
MMMKMNDDSNKGRNRPEILICEWQDVLCVLDREESERLSSFISFFIPLQGDDEDEEWSDADDDDEDEVQKKKAPARKAPAKRK